jgi:hypothetical protein
MMGGNWFKSLGWLEGLRLEEFSIIERGNMKVGVENIQPLLLKLSLPLMIGENTNIGRRISPTS